ncbi:MAG: type III pantothenate kinase [Vicinamibacterales bacterium]|nr:type III pantothenate kinase [Vicinamibacterales bacterium]
MLLAIDVGNTNVVLGVFARTRLTRSWRLATSRERTADEIGLMVSDLLDRAGITPARIDGVVLASVVPQLTGAMIDMCRRYLGTEPLNLEPGVITGMPNLYDNPAEVGADRIVNGMAAYERFGRARREPLIVVDFGTATTFDAITANGEYLGGVICPGIGISADALFQRAARLPRIDVRKPAQVIGRTTVTSMQSGLFFGYVGLVEGLVHRLRAELGGRAYVVATGGLAEVIAPETRVVDVVDRDLTMHGLRLLWERNRPATRRGRRTVATRRGRAR